MFALFTYLIINGKAYGPTVIAIPLLMLDADPQEQQQD